jgi:hypothetical protein
LPVDIGIASILSSEKAPPAEAFYRNDVTAALATSRVMRR